MFCFGFVFGFLIFFVIFCIRALCSLAFLGVQKAIKKPRIILAKCPNTVWVLHREKVVLGVVLSCYVVLGSRVVLCCVYLKSIGNPGLGGRM